ncbi:DUF3558 family protein [Actinopolyspora mortivallis]|uniref:DUF3558 domain-containing protein n=1 Tax=Actinopolyspora mortivallis TaxID=33906 RepID=A0A2T0GXQ6_ACTMO|nr:DUF3558 family protein [Actinopolyspora mortivallis]PRW63877.1 DUF3558 domain-containing protein [Actinopolyspora mortivallis]
MSLCVGTLLLAGCGGGGDTPTEETGTSSASSSVEPSPSSTREVPEEERRRLGRLSADELCELVERAEPEGLDFPVREGSPERLSSDARVRGCRFSDEEGERSLLVASQPEGLHDVGRSEVTELPVESSSSRHVDDCAVYSAVTGATLQVTVVDPEAGSGRCDTAVEISREVLRPLAY